jgi:hypothetical protein
MLRRKVPLGSENGGMMAIGGEEWGYVTARKVLDSSTRAKYTNNPKIKA